MSAEILPLDPYDAVLADLRAKRDQIDQTISLLEGLRCGNATPRPIDFSSNVAAEQPLEDHAGMFLGMSIVDATKKLLKLRKRSMGNPEILKELQTGGLVLTSAEPLNVVGSVLTRRFKEVGDVVRVSRGVWGLKEWYPGRTFKPAGKVAASSPSAVEDESEQPDSPVIVPENSAMGGSDGPRQF